MQSQQRLLREQQLAYRKLNEWEFKERQQKLPDLSIDDALTQYFQLIALSRMTADNHQTTKEIPQVERWQWRADLMRILKNKSQKLYASTTSSTS